MRQKLKPADKYHFIIIYFYKTIKFRGSINITRVNFTRFDLIVLLEES